VAGARWQKPPTPKKCNKLAAKRKLSRDVKRATGFLGLLKRRKK